MVKPFHLLAETTISEFFLTSIKSLMRRIIVRYANLQSSGGATQLARYLLMSKEEGVALSFALFSG